MVLVTSHIDYITPCVPKLYGTGCIEGVFSIIKRVWYKGGATSVEGAFSSATDDHIRAFFRGSLGCTGIAT